MSRYIIDTDRWGNLFDIKAFSILGIGDDYKSEEKTVWSRTYNVDELEELNSDYINEHYGGLQDEAYQRGLEDGKWKAEDGCDGCKYYEDTSLTNPCSECSRGHVDHYKSLSDPDRIEVGDEVTDLQSGANFVVTHLWKNNHGDKGVSGFNNDCSAFSATLDKVSKTGRHFDVDKILDEMKGNNDK